MNYIKILKPRIPKRYLLFVAAFAWTFAGSMLLTRGIFMVIKVHHYILISLFSAISGLIFYRFMFSKISLKHIKRIIQMEMEKPFVLSFFSIKSYIMMIVMISSGILLRKSGILPLEYMSFIYITMGIPLL